LPSDGEWQVFLLDNISVLKTLFAKQRQVWIDVIYEGKIRRIKYSSYTLAETAGEGL
jgi:hypothetical protein